MTLSESIPIDDCITVIFQFLSLQDILHYGATSIKNLRDVDPHLKEMRKQVVTDTMLYRSVSALSQALDSFSTSPSLRDQVHDLLSTLTKYRSPGKNDNVLGTAYPLDVNCPHNSPRVASKCRGRGVVSVLLSRQHEHLKFHKIYRIIISNVIDRWLNIPEVCAGAPHPNPTILLNKYIAGIICATCLLGNRIHGSPSELDWMQKLENNLYLNPGENDSSTWYSLWIMLHSTMLRTIPLLEDQLLLLGISTHESLTDTALSEWKDHRGITILPFRPPPSNVVRAMDAFIKNITQSRMIDFKIPDFGPLGNFRGRDRIHHVVLNIGEIGDLLLATTDTDYLRDNAYLETMRPMLSSLFHVQSQVFKSQPMTVAPPIVTLSENYYDSPQSCIYIT